MTQRDAEAFFPIPDLIARAERHAFLLIAGCGVFLLVLFAAIRLGLDAGSRSEGRVLALWLLIWVARGPDKATRLLLRGYRPREPEG